MTTRPSPVMALSSVYVTVTVWVVFQFVVVNVNSVLLRDTDTILAMSSVKRTVTSPEGSALNLTVKLLASPSGKGSIVVGATTNSGASLASELS